MAKSNNKIGADLVVDTLINQDVKYIFGIPGAKIDQVFDVLCERGPKLILTRHEQNAAFIAAAIGRITQNPGVVLVTSGPGASNLATGLVTANVEGDPIVAIAGNVQREDLLKRTHQSMDNAALFNPITKFSKEISHQDNISEVLTDAFRAAQTPRRGAAFVSLPADIIKLPVSNEAINFIKQPQENIPTDLVIDELVKLIKQAKMPVFFLGMRSSTIENTQAIRNLVAKYKFPIVETFQAAGVISRKLESHFYGRIGLFKNQPGDQLLHAADLIITIGFDPVEYYPRIWNKNNKTIIHIDEIAADSDSFYQPKLEVVANIVLTLQALITKLPEFNYSKDKPLLNKLQVEIEKRQLGLEFNFKKDSKGIHPLQLINTLRNLIDDNVTVTCDVGSHYIWMARYFRSYEARTLLFSNGMQTLGVALPWAIGAALVRPKQKVLSMSGDGGFLFSSMELETAVRLKLPIIHLIWNDGGFYDMVAFQQIMKYKRDSGVKFSNPDFVKYAESFGAVGLRINKLNELKPILQKALTYDKPVIVDIVVNYEDNIKLGQSLLEDQFN